LLEKDRDHDKDKDHDKDEDQKMGEIQYNVQRINEF